MTASSEVGTTIGFRPQAQMIVVRLIANHTLAIAISTARGESSTRATRRRGGSVGPRRDRHPIHHCHVLLLAEWSTLPRARHVVNVRPRAGRAQNPAEARAN